MSLPLIVVIELFTIASILVIALTLAAMPFASHPDIYFAITVAPSWRGTGEARRIARRFRMELALHSVIAALIVLAMARAAHPEALIPFGGICWIMLGSYLAYARARKAVQPHAVEPSMEREAVLQPRPAGLPGGWTLQLLPFAILLAMAVYLQSRWSEIPERFPIHWGVNGQANGWAPRTTGGVFFPLIIGAVIILFLLVISLSIAGTRRIHASGAAGLRETRFRAAVLRLLTGTEVMIALTMAGLAYLPLRSHPEQQPPVLLLVVPILTGVIIGTIALVRASLVKTPLPETDGDRPVGDRTLDRHWKGGLFYVNRDDPALLVEKRFGIGYTFNFGNPRSWLGLIAVAVLIALAVILPQVL
jgi:uncharacterized membrane protein